MSKKILVVDDELEICELITEALQDSGYQTFSAQTGREALDKAALEKPDLIILDIYLPDIDGVVVYEKLRSSSQHEKTPVIFLTGLATGTPARLAHSDVVDYSIIPKPANIERIQLEIDRLLR